MKTRTPVVPNDVKILAPEYLLPASVGNDSGRKRRNGNSESNTGPSKDSLPMEQRLSALNLDKATDAVAPPQADNMAQLLLQVLKVHRENYSSVLIVSVLFRACKAEIPRSFKEYLIEERPRLYRIL